MAFKSNQQISIKTRLHRVSLFSIVVFVLIALVLYFASMKAQKNIDRIVEESLQQTIKNSQNSRDFGLLHNRLSVFQNTFYADDKLLKTEGKALYEKLGVLQIDVSDSRLKDLLGQLQKQFSGYLEYCEWINYLLLWRSGQDKDINELLLFLQEIIAEKTVEVTLDGGDVDYLEQLILLTSGYRESLLEIAKLNAEENRSFLLSASIDAPFPLETELRSLALRLRTLTASEPPIDRLGQHLVSRLAHYQYLMRQYQQEMVRLGEQNQQLEQLTTQILSTMEQLDNQTAAAAIKARTEIKKSSNITAVIALGLLVLLAGVFWLSHRNIFRKHIQAPMDLINMRLEQFRQGDHYTPMSLERSDEWGEIEKIFNKMLFNLEESVSALQESEQRYRDIFNNATDGIFQAEISGKVINVNLALAEIFGYGHGDESEIMVEMASLNIQKDIYYRAEDRNLWLSLIQQNDEVRDFEVQMLRKNGSIFWAAVSGHLVRDSAGHAVCVEGTVRDISSQRSSQEALQQLQDYLQNIIDSMPSVLIGVDTNMQVTLWNKRAEQESILTAAEATGLPMTNVCRLFDSTAYIPKLLETLRTRKPTRLLKVESIKKTGDGRSRFFDILIYPLS
ncbi:MAG: PAS domain S-box protein, partial [Desulfuromusa sp.]|nr:PAS domain S-box protein [Desulfuromusa sp.]